MEFEKSKRRSQSPIVGIPSYSTFYTLSTTLDTLTEKVYIWILDLGQDHMRNTGIDQTVLWNRGFYVQVGPLGGRAVFPQGYPSLVLITHRNRLRYMGILFWFHTLIDFWTTNADSENSICSVWPLYVSSSKLQGQNFRYWAQDADLILNKRAGILDTEEVEPGLTVVYQKMPVGSDWVCGSSKTALLIVCYSRIISHSMVSETRDN